MFRTCRIISHASIQGILAEAQEELHRLICDGLLAWWVRLPGPYSLRCQLKVEKTSCKTWDALETFNHCIIKVRGCFFSVSWIWTLPKTVARFFTGSDKTSNRNHTKGTNLKIIEPELWIPFRNTQFYKKDAFKSIPWAALNESNLPSFGSWGVGVQSSFSRYSTEQSRQQSEASDLLYTFRRRNSIDMPIRVEKNHGKSCRVFGAVWKRGLSKGATRTKDCGSRVR